jgi:hypothetical protein
MAGGFGSQTTDLILSLKRADGEGRRCTLGTLRAVLEVSVRYEFFEKGILRKQGNSIQFPFLGSQKIKKT